MGLGVVYLDRVGVCAFDGLGFVEGLFSSGYLGAGCNRVRLLGFNVAYVFLYGASYGSCYWAVVYCGGSFVDYLSLRLRGEVVAFGCCINAHVWLCVRWLWSLWGCSCGGSVDRGYVYGEVSLARVST